MGKYDSLIAEAKITLTDLSMNSHNAQSDCSLRINEYMKILEEGIRHLAGKQKRTLFGKFKDAMFETNDDEMAEAVASELSNAVYQLKYCLNCKCSNCPLVDSGCNCGGCLYGSYVTQCDGQTEVRAVDKAAIKINGHNALSLNYDRTTGKTVATVINDKGARVNYNIDPKTGKTSPAN